jgi:hypothetical protein
MTFRRIGFFMRRPVRTFSERKSCMSTTIEDFDELRHYEVDVYERDLVFEMQRRLAIRWNYDSYIANAKGHPELIEFYRTVSSQEQASLARLQVLVKHYVSIADAPGAPE